MPYYDGYLLAVPTKNRQKYKDMADEAWPMFKRHGAIAMHENWGDDVPDGKVTSFPMATKKKDDETVVFSWVTWPDKATRDAGLKAMMEEMPAAPNEMPFDGMRMMWGGFTPLATFSAD